MSQGSAFQTFFLLFKTNAKEAKKDMQDMQKTSDETTKHIKKTREETTELGKAFTSAVEDATRALAAYVSFQAIKSGIINAQEYNRALTIQTKLWGQNANEIAGYGNAIKAAGGDLQGFYGWYDKLRQSNAQQGIKTLPLGQLMRHIHDQVKGLTPEMQQMIYQQYGIGDPGAQSILGGSDEDFEKSIAAGKMLASNTEAGSAAAQKFGKSWDNLTGSLTKFWTTVNTVILPPLAALFDALTALFNWLGEHKALATGFFVALAAAAVAFTAAIPSIVAGFGAISTAALAAAPALALFLGRLGAIVAIGVALPGASKKGGYAIGHWINRRLGRGNAEGVLPGHEGEGTDTGVAGTSAMDYLMKKHGLDAPHAAAIVANMNAESGGRVGQVGDGGQAHGLFQWHPDRQAKILAGTGIDVRTADRNSQLDAMMWEMKERGELNGFLGSDGAYDAGAFFSNNFERPAGGAFEAMKRGRAAMEIAGSTPFASQSNLGSSGGSNSVNIGKVEVHTQATDADGMAHAAAGALDRHIGGLYAQNNDAIAY